MNIYIGNLNYNSSEDEIMDLFSQYGEVTSVKIITDRETGRSRGFCFVTMADKQDGLNAIEQLNSSEFSGRTLVVNEARPRS